MKRIIAIIFLIMFFMSACGNSYEDGDAVYSLKNDIYDVAAREMLVDVFQAPDIGSKRLTQLVYNQPAGLIQVADDFYKIRLDEETEGYADASKLTTDMSSQMTNAEDQKILVTGDSKMIYKEPDGREPEELVVKGTVLPYRGKEGDWIKVAMCEGSSGYLTMNDIIFFSGDIPETDAASFIRDVSTFAGVRYLQGGISKMEGADMLNVVSICARINGHEIRPSIGTLEAQGTDISQEDIRPGDILFLSKDRYNDEVDDIAVVTADNVVLMHKNNSQILSETKMVEEDIRNRIRAVKRIFID